MGSHTTIAYGFPLKQQLPFTTVVTAEAREHGGSTTQVYWLDAYAAAIGIDYVPPSPWNHPDYPYTNDGSDPSAEAMTAYEEAMRVYQEGEEHRQAQDQLHRAYREQVTASLRERFGCAIHEGGGASVGGLRGGQGSPWFFVTALEPAVDHNAGKDHGYSYSPLPDLTVGAEVEGKLRAFCALMGIKYQQPSWIMIRAWWDY